MSNAIPSSSQASQTSRLYEAPRAAQNTAQSNATATTTGTDGTKANATADAGGAEGEGGSVRQQSLSQLNASIVKSSLAVAISSQNEPLALVLKSAITGINEALAPQFGDNAIQNAVGQDNSPEGTAGRIVALSTGFFGAFKQQHAGEDDAVVAQKFLDTIGSGIEQGFKEARDILGGLNVLNGDVAGNVDKTYALVQKGLADFASANGIGPGAASASTSASASAPKQSVN
jgi:hypothetical protein